MITQLEISPIDPLTDVVTVADAKAHCNCDVDVWDNQFKLWIEAARMALQEFTNSAFLQSNITCSIVQDVYEYGNNYITLPFTNNAVLSGSQYTLKGDRIYTDDEEIEITYKAGASPKAWMKQSVLMYVSDLYNNRGESKVGEGAAGKADVGEQAKQYCKGFINHGAFF